MGPKRNPDISATSIYYQRSDIIPSTAFSSSPSPSLHSKRRQDSRSLLDLLVETVSEKETKQVQVKLGHLSSGANERSRKELELLCREARLLVPTPERVRGPRRKRTVHRGQVY